MKKIYYFLLLLFCTVLAQTTFAQNILRVEIAPPGPDSFSVIKNGTYNLTLRLHNDSATDYTDVFDFNYTIDSAGAGAPQLYTDSGITGLGGLFFTNTAGTILSNSFVDIGITVDASEPRFKSGPSVVVIWPIRSNNSAVSGNMLAFTVNVLDPAGVDEPGETKLRAFKGENSLMIQRKADVQLNRLRIFDILGREVLNKQNPADNTVLPATSHGVYIAEITYNNNQRKVFRFYN